MITPAYVRTMARYNAWQNNQLMDTVKLMDQADLDKDRGAFFGSLQGTLSHLLWGDLLWMARFDPRSPAPSEPLDRSMGNFPTKTEWATERFLCDGRMRIWADGLRQIDLADDLTWVLSGTTTQQTRPLTYCITHFFNHQTHHRGQIHAMLSAAGQPTPVSDLSYLPEDA